MSKKVDSIFGGSIFNGQPPQPPETHDVPVRMTIPSDGCPIKPRNPATELLIAFLLSKQEGEVISDNMLTLVCGHDTRPGEKGYGYLRTAGEVLMREHGGSFRRIRNGNAIVMNRDRDKLGVAKSYIFRRAGAAATRGLKHVKTVDVVNLRPSERDQVSATRTMGEIITRGTRKMNRIIQQEVKKENDVRAKAIADEGERRLFERLGIKRKDEQGVPTTV